ncbi:MAG: hypothetical protein JW814_05910, partial [Candidatus Krumholzibacteriota bacterium]|nr:hypothetical protein [Candidatus Krumholzibacteriota bacterium]
MKTRVYKPRYIPVLLLLVAALAFSSCSEKITSSAPAQEIALRIDLAGSNLDGTVAATFLVTVTGPGIAEPIEQQLYYLNGYLGGEVVVPAGPERRFRLEALGYGGEVIYSGETVADVEPDGELSLTIELHPRVQMVKVSPMYDVKPMGTTLKMKIRVFNLNDLHTFEGVLYNNGMTSEYTYRVENVVINPMLSDIAALTWSTREDNSVRFNVTCRTEGGTIVDSNGDAFLATVYIWTFFNDWPAESIHFYPSVTLMKDNTGSDMSVKDVYREDANVSLFPYSAAILAEYKLGWGTGSEDPSWIEDTSPNALHGTAT